MSWQWLDSCLQVTGIIPNVSFVVENYVTGNQEKSLAQDGDSLLWTVIGSSPEVQSLYVIPHEKHFVSLDWPV
jgi:hypothetical protein